MKIIVEGVYNILPAISGMRNPLKSWDKSDSTLDEIGPKDLALACKLIRGGTEHRKFLRQIFVALYIDAPMYWWAQMDTYRVGVTRNSTSFMHTGTKREITINDFEVPKYIKDCLLDTDKPVNNSKIEYPYETEEYKEYTTSSGRVYEVYRNGRIFAKEFSYTDTYGTGRERKFPRKEVSPYKSKNGYWSVRIGGRDCEHWLVSRLVATVFLDNPDNLATVDHLNGNKNNNSVENLQWVSLAENIKRQQRDRPVKQSIRNKYKVWKSLLKLDPRHIHRIKKEYADGATEMHLCRKYNISQATVWAILNGKRSELTDTFVSAYAWEKTIEHLNILREEYNETKDPDTFDELRSMLPSGAIYGSSITLNYENVLNIIHQRENHKLREWHKLCDALMELPYIKEFTDALNQKE